MWESDGVEGSVGLDTLVGIGVSEEVEVWVFMVSIHPQEGGVEGFFEVCVEFCLVVEDEVVGAEDDGIANGVSCWR